MENEKTRVTLLVPPELLKKIQKYHTGANPYMTQAAAILKIIELGLDINTAKMGDKKDI